MKRWRVVLRVLAICVTAASVALMFAPQAFRAPVLSLGLGGQFLVGTVVLAALAFEVFEWASGSRDPSR